MLIWTDKTLLFLNCNVIYNFFKSLHWFSWFCNWDENQLKWKIISDNGGEISHSRQQSHLKIQGKSQFLKESLDNKRLSVLKKASQAFT